MDHHLPAGYQAKFITGAVRANHFPHEDFPETAFAGRSNVGKSSLLNRILLRRKLARVSRTPGRTQEINFFEVGQRWMFVDLPGYGFAQVGRNQKEAWNQSMETYFSHRRSLRAVILLLDLRRGITLLDQDLMVHLAERGISWLPVATKIDKLKANPRREALKTLTKELETAPGFAILPLVAVSSLTGEGMAALWQRLNAILADGLET